VKETDAIFAKLQETHQQAAGAEDTLRLSLDAKAPVLIGPFSRRGKGRKGNQGADHDFKPWGKLPPFGIFLPDYKDLSFYFTHSKVTSDFMVDRLGEWWQSNRAHHPKVRRLLLDLDNGPENHSRRTQFIYRLVLFAQATQLTIVLVYYPPYHSKYNPIERCWGVLEVYWNGELLLSEAAVLGLASNMTYAGKHPQVYRVNQTYNKGVRRTKDEMQSLERRLVRLEGLPKWFVTIEPPKPSEIILPA
jgi:Rhodopirellula transposase DDE domain